MGGRRLIRSWTLVWGTFFETLNGMEEINLKREGYDQSIFRSYAPGQYHNDFHLDWGVVTCIFQT